MAFLAIVSGLEILLQKCEGLASVLFSICDRGEV